MKCYKVVIKTPKYYTSILAYGDAGLHYLIGEEAKAKPFYDIMQYYPLAFEEEIKAIEYARCCQKDMWPFETFVVLECEVTGEVVKELPNRIASGHFEFEDYFTPAYVDPDEWPDGAMMVTSFVPIAEVDCSIKQ